MSKFHPDPTLFTRVITQKKPKLGPIGSLTPQNRGIFWIKSRTTNTHKLKVVDPEIMGRYCYYRLYENLCGPLGPAPGGNLGPFWAEKMGFFDNFYKNSPIYLVVETCVI